MIGHSSKCNSSSSSDNGDEIIVNQEINQRINNLQKTECYTTDKVIKENSNANDAAAESIKNRLSKLQILTTVNNKNGSSEEHDDKEEENDEILAAKIATRKAGGLKRVMSETCFLRAMPAEDTAEDAARSPAAPPTVHRHLEVMVACECCGMSEECTVGYIERVRQLYSGHWICGLCAEAVQEERHRLATHVVDDALRSHMSQCRSFSGGGGFGSLGAGADSGGSSPSSPAVAHAVCHMFRRRLTSPCPTPPLPSRNPGGGGRGGVAAAAHVPSSGLARTSSCLPSFGKNIPSVS